MQQEENTSPPAHEIAPIGTVAEGIAARIATERERLAFEEKRERELTDDRKRLLTAGSDQDVDECERGIDASRSSQMRSLERLELLTAQLEDENRKARNAELDEIAANAEAARKRGVECITKKYPPLARKLADLLAELKSCEDTITAANAQLHNAGREMIDAANSSRHAASTLNDDTNLPHENADEPNYATALSDIDKYARWQILNTLR
jgi:hypothetical protein